MDYKNGKIYKILCPDGQFYFGSTASDMTKRKSVHKTHTTHMYNNSKLYKTIRKFNWDDIIFQIIEKYPCKSKQELCMRENFYISQHRKDKKCLNNREAYAKEGRIECEHCERSFKNICSLNHHQKTAKYCLKIQEQNGDEVEFLHQCVDCSKVLSNHYGLSRHYKVCVDRLVRIAKEDSKQEIECLKEQIKFQRESYDKQIEKLQDRIQDLASQAIAKPTTINTSHKTQINNFVQKLERTTDERITTQASNFNIEHIQKGVMGYVDYALEHPFKDRLACIDFSRRKLKFKDKDGRIVTDPEMARLAQKLFSSIQAQNTFMITQYMREFEEKWGTFGTQELFEDMNNYMNMVNKGADGEKTPMYNDFIKHICSRTLPRK